MTQRFAGLSAGRRIKERDWNQSGSERLGLSAAAGLSRTEGCDGTAGAREAPDGGSLAPHFTPKLLPIRPPRARLEAVIRESNIILSEEVIGIRKGQIPFITEGEIELNDREW